MKEIKCKHYKGDGYTYKLKSEKISLCNRCELLLRLEMKKQEALERRVSRLFLK